jgi:short-subunit dehydrogenase
MKIAITGHSQGIGKELARIYTERGNEVIGLSRSNGHNIRSVPKVAAEIEPADVFINNAQAGYAQTELLFDVFERWISEPKKHIIVISTHMTRMPVSPLAGLEMDQYRVQKIALEEACIQLRHKRTGPRITVVRPGAVNTAFHADNAVPNIAETTVWAEGLVKILDSAGPDLWIPEISLLPRKK